MNATIAVLKMIADANGGIVTTEEALRAGTNRVTLKRYADKGVLTRIARGQYTMTGFVPDEFTLLQSGSENLVYSYGSAMYFWGLSDRTPHTYDITLPRGTNVTLLKRDNPNLRCHHVQKVVYDLGITEVKSPQGATVRVYDKERCICDLIRDKNQIDLQIYSQALKDYFKTKPNIRKLLKYGKFFGIKEKIITYIEVL